MATGSIKNGDSAHIHYVNDNNIVISLFKTGNKYELDLTVKTEVPNGTLVYTFPNNILPYLSDGIGYSFYQQTSGYAMVIARLISEKIYIDAVQYDEPVAGVFHLSWMK